MRRRDEVIDAAASLLRESGPGALTSGNVAARVGMTQSAIYRHIRDMNELTTIASEVVAGELHDLLMGIGLMGIGTSQSEASGNGVDTEWLSRRIVAVVIDQPMQMAVIDRWRHADGELGAGIRNVLLEGAELIAEILLAEWVGDYGYDRPIGPTQRRIALDHAGIMQDDVITVGRQLRLGALSSPAAAERLLSLRFFAGWCGYCVQMNHHAGIAIPDLGSPLMMPPHMATA